MLRIRLRKVDLGKRKLEEVGTEEMVGVKGLRETEAGG